MSNTEIAPVPPGFIMLTAHGYVSRIAVAHIVGYEAATKGSAYRTDIQLSPQEGAASADESPSTIDHRITEAVTRSDRTEQVVTRDDGTQYVVGPEIES